MNCGFDDVFIVYGRLDQLPIAHSNATDRTSTHKSSIAHDQRLPLRPSVFAEAHSTKVAHLPSPTMDGDMNSATDAIDSEQSSQQSDAAPIDADPNGAIDVTTEQPPQQQQLTATTTAAPIEQPDDEVADISNGAPVTEESDIGAADSADGADVLPSSIKTNNVVIPTRPTTKLGDLAEPLRLAESPLSAIPLEVVQKSLERVAMTSGYDESPATSEVVDVPSDISMVQHQPVAEVVPAIAVGATESPLSLPEELNMLDPDHVCGRVLGSADRLYSYRLFTLPA